MLVCHHKAHKVICHGVRQQCLNAHPGMHIHELLCMFHIFISPSCYTVGLINIGNWPCLGINDFRQMTQLGHRHKLPHCMILRLCRWQLTNQKTKCLRHSIVLCGNLCDIACTEKMIGVFIRHSMLVVQMSSWESLWSLGQLHSPDGFSD